METNKHYFVVGMFIVVTTVLALIFTVWLTSAGKGDFVHYRIRFAESVSGLPVGGAVKFRGVDVGTVDKITIDPVDTRLIRVDIKVEKGTPIKTDAVANLKLQGVTGVVFVELTGGSPNAQLMSNIARPGEVLEIRAEQSSLNAIVDRLPELVDKASVFADQVNKLVDQKNVDAVTDIITQWQMISKSLAGQMGKLDALIQNSNAVAADMRNITRDAKQDIKEMTANLNETSQQANALLRDMRKTTRHISGLTGKLEEDPSRLVFPDKDKGVPAP